MVNMKGDTGKFTVLNTSVAWLWGSMWCGSRRCFLQNLCGFFCGCYDVQAWYGSTLDLLWPRLERCHQDPKVWPCVGLKQSSANFERTLLFPLRDRYVMSQHSFMPSFIHPSVHPSVRPFIRSNISTCPSVHSVHSSHSVPIVSIVPIFPYIVFMPSPIHSFHWFRSFLIPLFIPCICFIPTSSFIRFRPFTPFVRSFVHSIHSFLRLFNWTIEGVIEWLNDCMIEWWNGWMTE